MCTAAWERDDDLDQGDEPMAVRVETQPDGGQTFLGYTADCYERGQLTITALDTGAERVFYPDEWRHAIAYDTRGNVLFSFENPLHQPAA